MKLSIKKRSTDKKCQSNRLRREGHIPAVLYVRGKESLSISVAQSEFDSILRSLVKGRLSTTIFTLVDEKGQEKKAIVKDIQHHPTSYKILHLDFEELHPDVPVNVKVPIECTGVIECAGIKLGGVLRRVIRFLRVNCLPEDIPNHFDLDVRELSIKQYKRLADLTIPEKVRPLANLDEVAVVIAKR
jgi:large subunit ribosomal protein L25